MCVYGADIYSIACKGASGSGSYKHSDSYRHTGREYQGESFLPAEGGRLHFFGDSDIYDDLRPGYDPSELFDVREFQNGDRLQSVHWKLSARTDELMVKENSLPKACAVAIVADLRGIKKGRQADAFMKLLVSLSFSLMDQKCSHYVAWYDTAINDIVRARVDDEEGFYIFLNSFLKIKPDTKNDALFLYEEKYRAEKLVCLLSVDGRLQIKRGEEIVGRADEKNEIVI